jgi:diaminopimelate decarboxylase|tara:strand:- start:260 stop:1537 length:1278 start_codon:yes stop_codon:yes gene_type:complete
MTLTTTPHPLQQLISDHALAEDLACEFGTPLYIYDADRLRDNTSRMENALSGSFPKSQICYALKANSNPHILSVLLGAASSLGADCSSPGELYIAQRLNIPPERCIYTGNYESPEELKTALDSGVHLNLDDSSSYFRLRKIGIPKEISFRLNPGFGKGRFPAIVTAGREAKFGIPREKIIDAYRLAQDDGVERFGLQCMTGSGNLDPGYFVELLSAILTVAREIEESLGITFEYISMGGGFGIPYKLDESPLDVSELFESLGKVFGKFYDRNSPDTPALFIEPGKFLVADAGFILSRVTGVKESYKRFVGLDAGMNTLIRPALYNAYHRILKIGEPEAPTTQTVDVTGGICENSDRLAVDRDLPTLKEGDIMAIMDAGAYGYVMATPYNTRSRPAEVLMENGKPRMIRKKETIEDIFAGCNWNGD